MLLRFLITGLLFCVISGQEQESPIVTIPDGQVRGSVGISVRENVTYYAYRGIPFAKPPVGDLRFASPVKNDPWTGVLNATKDRDACVQLSTLGLSGDGQIGGSEDCLYINVYTTDVNGSLPVMVWIYGGGFIFGSSGYNITAPDYLIEKDVIFVSFNYRLGVFGFLSTEDTVAPGNWGLKDQVLALKWVKENIQNFGGDPNRITIFGESAGAASVSYMVQTNKTKGLFNGAIMESGNSLCLWSLSRDARTKAFEVGVKLGIFTLSSQSLINNLRKADYKALKLAEANVTTATIFTRSILAGLPFGPVKEPVHAGAVFSGKSHELLTKGQFNNVSLIIGFNSFEGNSLQDTAALLRPIMFQYELDVSRLAPFDLSPNFFKRVHAGVAVRTHYFGPSFGPNTKPIASQPEAVTKFFTVDQFNRPTREIVNVMSDHAPVYYYQFSYEGLLGDQGDDSPGVGHAEELPYLFAYQNRSSTEKDREISDKFVTLWTNFAKTGNPTSSSSGGPLQGVNWIPNAPGDQTNTTIKYLNINDTLTMKTNPDQIEWAFYQGIYKRYGDPPYTTY